MIHPFDKRFFQALKETCETVEDIGQPCRDAIDRALDSTNPEVMRAARLAVEELEDSVKERVLAQVHRKMSTDLSAIWSALPTAPKSGLHN